MGGKVGENPAALRAAVFLLSAKNRRGVFKHPPAGRRLKGHVNLEIFGLVHLNHAAGFLHSNSGVKMS